MNYSLKKISEIFNVDFIGNEAFTINKVSSISNADENSIIFFSDKKFLDLLKGTNSKVVIIGSGKDGLPIILGNQ